MIGIIGPVDSVESVVRVAEAMGVRETVVGRAYHHTGEALAVSRELDVLSRVLLFTGRIPYAIARREGNWRSTLDFIPHSGVDLYRAMVLLLRERGGVLPELTIDTIELAKAAAAFEDLDLPPPRHVLPLKIEAGPAASQLDAMVAFHTDRFRSGDVELCLTCVGAVHERLTAAGVPSHRVEHTRSSIRDALERAGLVSMLAQSQSTQTAIGLIEIPSLQGSAPSGEDFYETRRTRLRLQQSLLDYAEGLHGTLSTPDDRTFIVHTTRGAIEEAIDRQARGHASALQPRDLPVDTAIGFGLGFSMSATETSARRALASARETGGVHVLFADGRLHRLGDPHEGFGRPALVTPPQELGLGRLALARLLAALRRLDSHDLTAQELADAYGVQPRSARRLLSQLEEAGLVTAVAQQMSGERGRPRKRYAVDTDRLARLASGTDEQHPSPFDHPAEASNA